MSIQGTFVMPIHDVANPYTTIKTTSNVSGRSAPNHIARTPTAIHKAVRAVPATTKTGILPGKGSTTREMKICGHDQPIRIKALASPTIMLEVLRVCTKAGSTRSELTNVIAAIIKPPFRTSSQ